MDVNIQIPVVNQLEEPSESDVEDNSIQRGTITEVEEESGIREAKETETREVAGGIITPKDITSPQGRLLEKD